MSLNSVWGVLKGTVNEFMEDRVLRLSAALAYYAIFSIGPLLVLIVGVAGLVLGEENVRREVAQQLQGLVGEKSAQLVESMMGAQEKGGSLLATVIGGVGLLIGASGVFGQLQDALNTIWEVTSKPGQGIWGFIRQRFLSMSMVLGVGFLLLISMALTTAVDAFAGYVEGMISLPAWVAHAFNFLLSFGVVTVLFALIFKVLPDVKIRWGDVWVGAVGTALLFALGKFLLGIYLGRAGSSSAYGAGSAFVVVLLYIYYSSIVLFFGAEFTQVYVRQRGRVIKPAKYAVRLTEQERAKQGMPRDKEVEAAAHKAESPGSEPSSGGLQYATKKGTIMSGSEKQIPITSRPRLSPGERVHAQPWSFVIVAVGAGLAAGFLFRFRTARRVLKWYTLARRVI